MDGQKQESQNAADDLLAYNLRKLREDAGLSQAELARQMSELGHPWYQSTVGRVENGRQSLKFAEAVSVARILHTSLDRFTWSTTEASAEHIFSAGLSAAERAMKQIADATSTLRFQQWSLGKAIKDQERTGCHGSDRIRGLVEEARTVLTYTPEEAVREGDEDHAQRLADIAERGYADEEDDDDGDA